jgi:hypothetical protein
LCGCDGAGQQEGKSNAMEEGHAEFHSPDYPKPFVPGQ